MWHKLLKAEKKFNLFLQIHNKELQDNITLFVELNIFLTIYFKRKIRINICLKFWYILILNLKYNSFSQIIVIIFYM